MHFDAPGSPAAPMASGVIVDSPLPSAVPRDSRSAGGLGEFGMTRTGGRQPDWLGRSVGLAVFAGGIVLLVVVFVQILQLGNRVPPTGIRLDWHWGVGFGVNIVSLLVAGLVASWIAGRGAQLYAAANRAVSGE